MKHKKIAVFGCKSTTLFITKFLRNIAHVNCLVTISPDQGKKNKVADYLQLSEYCKKNDIQCFEAHTYNLNDERDVEFFKESKFDLGFVIGWQRLIPHVVLESFFIGIFGMHGSTDDLPIGRGRSPMNWALIEQRKHFFTNIFKYDAGVDSGNILDTFCFDINHSDTSETMHYKNVLAMKTLIQRNLPSLISKDFLLKKQRQITATYYPKRTPDDGIIDWNHDIFKIDAFIRAVTKPFDGAFSYLDNVKIIIWNASIFVTDLIDYGFKENDNGTILEVFPSGKFLIKCRGGILIVHDYDCEQSVKSGKIINSPVRLIKNFKLNKSGFHDLEL